MGRRAEPPSVLRLLRLRRDSGAALATTAALVLFAAGSALTTRVGSSIPEASPPFDLAAALESQGEFARALELVRARAGFLPPGDAEREALRTELRLAVREGRDAEALSLLGQASGCLEPETETLLRAALQVRLHEDAACLQTLRAPLPAEFRGYAALLESEAAAALERWDEGAAAARRALGSELPVEMRDRLLVLRALAALHTAEGDTLRALGPQLGRAAARDDATGLLLLQAARASAAAGNTQQADSWMLELLQARPAPAESAYAMLRRLPAVRVDALQQSAPRLARHEMQTGRWAEAQARLVRAIESSGEPATRSEARLLLAEVYQRQGELHRALRVLERAARAANGTRFAPEVLRARARTLKRLGRDDAALESYRQLARRFPAHPAADDALYEVGWIYEGRRQFRRAELAYLRCLRAYPRATLADDAQLRAGLCALRDARAADASAHLRALAARRPPSPLLDNALYWRMVARQRLGDAAGALALRDRLEHDFPRSYYTVLARQRVERGLTRSRPAAAESGTSESGQPLQIEDAVSLAGRAHATYDLAISTLRREAGLQPPAGFESAARLWRFLLDHGLAREAACEERRLEKVCEGQPGALLEILAACHARGAHERLVRLAYKLSLSLDAAAYREPLEVLLYPAPYGITLSAAVHDHGLSHATVLGLMRQESAFDPSIDSGAGARGLMQVMPQVGRRLWRDSGRGDLAPDSLYRPDVNIALGCRLLAEELRRSGGDLPQALAAYNAGSQPAAAWRRRVRAHEPPELYLDVVEYFETRSYLESVLGNREVYARVYALP